MRLTCSTSPFLFTAMRTNRGAPAALMAGGQRRADFTDSRGPSSAQREAPWRVEEVRLHVDDEAQSTPGRAGQASSRPGKAAAGRSSLYVPLPPLLALQACLLLMAW